MKYLDVVATSEAIPGEHLERGQVGTIVEELESDMMLVEFSDSKGACSVLVPISVRKLIQLKDPAVVGFASEDVEPPSGACPSDPSPGENF